MLWSKQNLKPMPKTLVIYRRELAAYLYTPLAYAVAASYLAIGGYFFAVFITSVRQASVAPILGNLGLVTLFVAPILTMRLFAEEFRLGTDELLFSTPVSMWHVVLGKYLAATSVLGMMLTFTLVYPMILSRYGQPDWGPIWSGFLGLFIFSAFCGAVGLFASSLTDNQTVAGVLGFTLLLLLWVIDWAAEAIGGRTGDILAAVSIARPLGDFRLGIVDTTHLVFYASLIFFFLFLSVRFLENRLWSEQAADAVASGVSQP